MNGNRDLGRVSSDVSILLGGDTDCWCFARAVSFNSLCCLIIVVRFSCKTKDISKTNFLVLCVLAALGIADRAALHSDLVSSLMVLASDITFLGVG